MGLGILTLAVLFSIPGCNKTNEYSFGDLVEEMDYSSSINENFQGTTSQENAVRSADMYMTTMYFSRQGLIKQLELEGHTEEDAVFAADYVEADWDKQAAGCAKNYLKIRGFSKAGLINQLQADGFTSGQAKYGVDLTGADWKEEATRCGKEYLKTMSFTRAGLIQQLELEGFTHDQAVYGADGCGL